MARRPRSRFKQTSPVRAPRFCARWSDRHCPISLRRRRRVLSSSLSPAAVGSPDGAKRNPGGNEAFIVLPDFTSFHPGYERKREAERRKAFCPTSASVDAAAGEAHPPAFRRCTAVLSLGKFVPSSRRGPGQVSWVPVVVPADVMPEPPWSRPPYPPARRRRIRSASRNTFAKGVPSERDSLCNHIGD
jgi:hypothetical protein